MPSWGILDRPLERREAPPSCTVGSGASFSLTKGYALHREACWRMTGSALTLEESRDGRIQGPEGKIFIKWGGPGGEWWRQRSSRLSWPMTGSALRLEESCDGRCFQARRRKHLSSGGVQGGSGGGIGPPFSVGG